MVNSKTEPCFHLSQNDDFCSKCGSQLKKKCPECGEMETIGKMCPKGTAEAFEERFESLTRFSECFADSKLRYFSVFEIKSGSNILLMGKTGEKGQSGIYHWWDDFILYGNNSSGPQESIIKSSQELMKILGDKKHEFLNKVQ